MKQSRFLKILQKIGSFLWKVLVVLLILALIHVVQARQSGQVPDIMGYSIFRITTGSMEPTIPTGMYILVQKTPPEEIREGDIITFYSTNVEIAGMPNTHRVSAPPEKTPIGYRYETKGDNNFITDKNKVMEDRLIGRYLCNLEKLTKLVDFFMTRSMLLILLIVQGLSLTMMGFSVKILEKNKKDREDMKAQEKRTEELKAQAIEEYLKQQKEEKKSAASENAEEKQEEKEETK